MVIDIREALINESIRRITKKAREDFESGEVWVEGTVPPFLTEENVHDMVIHTLTNYRIARMTRLN